MPTHIALLRGINLAGHKKVSMAGLREVVSSLGHSDVATYIQSGNVVFSTRQAGAGTASLAAEMEKAIAAELSVQAGVVVLTRDELARVVSDNPYPDEQNPKFVHAIFMPRDFGPELEDALAALQQRAAEKDSPDTARLVGRVVFLHTPGGYGRSVLAPLLGRAGGPMAARQGGTARNWATVTKLLALCDA